MTIIDKLEAAGLVERRVSTMDRRMHALQLSTTGRKSFPGINRKVVEHEQRFQNSLTLAEQATLLTCLWKIRNA
jgi:DNA-binding MarR family transcriptional regulator